MYFSSHSNTVKKREASQRTPNRYSIADTPFSACLTCKPTATHTRKIDEKEENQLIISVQKGNSHISPGSYHHIETHSHLLVTYGVFPEWSQYVM